MNINRETTFSVLLIALLGWTGCAGTSPGRSGGDVLDLGLLAKDFWRVREPVTIGDVESPSVAVAEFTVEYAPASETGEHLDFGRSMMVELPGVLYRGFVAALPAYDRHAVPLEAVNGADAYQRLKGARMEDLELDSAPQETGRRYPVHGLLSIEGDRKETDAVLKELLEEVEADYALLVNLRVGVRGGRASIEKGSTVRVVARDGVGVLETALTLLSARRVVEKDPDSDVTAIDSRRFVGAVERLFRPCIGMALIRTGRDV